jgi:hypothetical protein
MLSNKKPIRLFTFALLAALALSGCSTPTPKFVKPEEPNLSLVFGYIDMEEAPTKLKWVALKMVRPVVKEPYYNFWVREGAFFRSHVRQGSYKFEDFGGGNTRYIFPSQGKGVMDRQITTPGLYYVGSYKFKKISRGIFRTDEFDLVPTNSPSELELLKKIVGYAEDDYWKAMIQRRIRELEK